MPQFPAVVVWAAILWRRMTSSFAWLLIGAMAVLAKPLLWDACLWAWQGWNGAVALLYRCSGNTLPALSCSAHAERIAAKRRSYVSSKR